MNHINPPTNSTTDSHKGGRPKKPEKELRLHPVKVYFDERSYCTLLRKRARTSMSLSSLVYELAVNGYVKEPIPKDALALLRSLSGMANNLNQLAHLAHVSHFIEVEKEVLDVAQRVDEVLIKLSEK